MEYDQALPAVLKVLSDNDNRDPILRHAGIMALAGIKDNSKLTSLKTSSSDAVRLAAVVALRKQANPIIVDYLTDTSPSVLKEAVRAIHDVPQLHSQLPALAKLNVAPESEDAIVSRILNANFRLGREQDAIRLANFAARSACKDSMRMEALAMLSTWAKPGNRDRVMNRHQPLEARKIDIVTSILRERIEELSATPVAVRDKFFEIGSALGLTELTKLILKTAQDKNADGVRRAAAIRALAGLAPDSIQPLMDMLIQDANADVRMASLAFQVQSNPEASIPSLRRAILSDKVRERQFAWDQLATLDSGGAKETIVQGVKSYLDGTLARDSWINVVEAANGKLDNALEKKLAERVSILEGVKESDPKRYFEDCIDGGDVGRGRMLFFTRSSLSCVRCHKVGQTGGDVGPNLSALGSQKPRDYMLEAIVAPNTVIAQGFETVVILDDNGNTFSGILKSEDDAMVTLMDAQGALVKIEKNSIEGRRKGASSMPADLMKYLNKRELRDLVAYLSSLDGSENATGGLDDSNGGHKVE